MNPSDELYYNVIFEKESNLLQYDKLLSEFPQWKSFNREIKLTLLLEGKRVQYDIDNISTTKSFLFGSIGGEDKSLSVKDISFFVKSMSFVINGSIVESLKIGIQTLNSLSGKILENMINDSVDLVIKQKIINDVVVYFYIEKNP